MSFRKRLSVAKSKGEKERADALSLQKLQEIERERVIIEDAENVQKSLYELQRSLVMPILNDVRRSIAGNDASIETKETVGTREWKMDLTKLSESNMERLEVEDRNIRLETRLGWNYQYWKERYTTAGDDEAIREHGSCDGISIRLEENGNSALVLPGGRVRSLPLTSAPEWRNKTENEVVEVIEAGDIRFEW